MSTWLSVVLVMVVSSALSDAYNTNHVWKRAADDHSKNELYFECDSTYDTVMRRHPGRNPTAVVRQPIPTNMITTNPNPILSYATFQTFSYHGNKRVDLPLAVDALITMHTLLAVRGAFTSDVHNNYDRMGRLLSYDERGHILASRLGGPMETYNVFPQSWLMNRGRGSMWFSLETDIDAFLRNNPNRYVRFSAVLSYPTDNNHVLMHRPSAILLRVRAFNNGVQVNLSNGTPVTAQNPNTTENIYLSNDPNQRLIQRVDYHFFFNKLHVLLIHTSFLLYYLV